MLRPTPEIIAARAQWTWRGQQRPPFADPSGPGQLSVWDFPRPPRLEAVALPLLVVHNGITLARTTRGMRVLETAGAPTYYLPPEDVEQALLAELDSASVCEWKGVATSFALAEDPKRQPVAWCYRETFPEFAAIAGWYAFYPNRGELLPGRRAGNSPARRLLRRLGHPGPRRPHQGRARFRALVSRGEASPDRHINQSLTATQDQFPRTGVSAHR